MTFSRLALNNIRGSMLRYAAFFLSSVFSVLLFFMYAQFIFHPDVTGGHIYGGESTRLVLIVCEYLIIIFSFFFVLYSSSAFLQARQQEFGLLTLLGMTRRQLRQLIWLENTLLSVAAIVTGILFGLLFSKLFLLGISKILLVETPIRFAVVPQAVLLTAAGFFVLFQVITVVNGLLIGRSDIIELLRAARKPKLPPQASVVLAVLALVLIAGGYVVAVLVPGAAIVLAFVPVVAVVVLGTHLLFTQGSVYFLRWLQRRPGYYLSGTRTLVISQLVFRMRDNARLLSSVATLSAVVLSAAGTFYIFSQQFADAGTMLHPQAVALLERGNQPGGLPAQVEEILERHGIAPTVRIDVPAVEVPYRTAPGGESTSDAAVIPWTAYRGIVGQTSAGKGVEAALQPLEPGHALFIDPYRTADVHREAAGELPYLVQNDETRTRFITDAVIYRSLLSPLSSSGPWFVVTDTDFAVLQAQAAPASQLRLHAYDWKGWDRTRAANSEIRLVAADAGRGSAVERFSETVEIRQALSLSMFIGVFVSLLFFIGAGSMLYFKLFTELPDDRRLFHSLRRIGITSRETRRAVSAQMALIFFLPFFVGALHAAFALRSLGNMLMADVSLYSLVVIGLFALIQTLFYGLTRWTYLRALLPAHR